MKFVNSIVVLFLLFTLLFNCSADNEDTNLVKSPNVATGDESASNLAKTAIRCPISGEYDVVLMDADEWEILLNINRERPHCNSYTGILWYMSGSYTFTGKATAVYNHSLDLLCVTAIDSGWDGGHIMYGLKFTEDTNDLYGSYVYYESPRRTSGINAWLLKGSLGSHVVTTTTLSKSVFYTPPEEHPKKKRFEMEMEKEE